MGWPAADRVRLVADLLRVVRELPPKFRLKSEHVITIRLQLAPGDMSAVTGELIDTALQAASSRSRGTHHLDDTIARLDAHADALCRAQHPPASAPPDGGAYGNPSGPPGPAPGWKVPNLLLNYLPRFGRALRRTITGRSQITDGGEIWAELPALADGPPEVDGSPFGVDFDPRGSNDAPPPAEPGDGDGDDTEWYFTASVADGDVVRVNSAFTMNIAVEVGQTDHAIAHLTIPEAELFGQNDAFVQSVAVAVRLDSTDCKIIGNLLQTLVVPRQGPSEQPAQFAVQPSAIRSACSTPCTARPTRRSCSR